MAATQTLLASLLSQHESDVLEFKTQHAEPSTIARIVTAFLNSRGGTIVIGASDSGAWEGVDNAQNLVEELNRSLPTQIAPEADLRIERVEESGREGVLIEVPPGGTKPYVFDGAIYVRAGAQTKAASPADITRLVTQRGREEERWERQPALGMAADDLDVAEIDRTLEAAVQRFQYLTGDYNHPMMKLQRMDLADESWPRHAAIVLFIQELSNRRYPQLAVHATALRGEDRRDFLDDKVFEGNAFDLFDRIMEFVSRHTSVSSTIQTGETVRADRPAIPALVLREAILNAIAHREYQETAPIQLRLFSNRLELWNPGSIPQELIEQPGISRPRNPDIARVLYLRGLVDMRGVGMLRMRDEMATLNLPEPRWENRSGGTQVTIPFTTEAARDAQQAAADAEAKALSERAFAYLADAKKGDRITREEYQERFAKDVAERSARNDLKRLVEFGYLRQVGAASKTAYIRTEKTAPTL